MAKETSGIDGLGIVASLQLSEALAPSSEIDQTVSVVEKNRSLVPKRGKTKPLIGPSAASKGADQRSAPVAASRAWTSPELVPT